LCCSLLYCSSSKICGACANCCVWARPPRKLHLTLARRALPTKQTYKCLKLHSRNIGRTKRFLVLLFVSWLSVTFEETNTTDFNNFCRRNCPRAAIQKRVWSEHCQHYNYKWLILEKCTPWNLIFFNNRDI